MLVHVGYELQFAAPFHLGTGISVGSIDRTVIRDADGNLYVPASTFKGVLREHCEQLCRMYLPDMNIPSPHDAYAALAEYGHAPNLISRIFGSQLHPTNLRFNNARQEKETRKLYRTIQTTNSTQARIDRVTRTAVDQALYTSEFGTRYLLFEGTIKGQLDCTPIEKLTSTGSGQRYSFTPTYSLLVLLAGLLMIERLGSNKSSGKGQCICTITSVVLDNQPCTKEEWQSWIEQLDVLEGYVVETRGGHA